MQRQRGVEGGVPATLKRSNPSLIHMVFLSGIDQINKKHSSYKQANEVQYMFMQSQSSYSKDALSLMTRAAPAWISSSGLDEMPDSFIISSIRKGKCQLGWVWKIKERQWKAGWSVSW